MAKIVIVSGLQQATNPRAVKEAMALTAAGHEVTVLSSLVNPELKSREESFSGQGWRVIRLADASDPRPAAKLRWQYLRLRHRLGREMARRFQWQTPASFGYFSSRLLAACRPLPADLYLCHTPEATWAGIRLLRRGRRVAFDFEDWYSRDLPEADRRMQSLRLLELVEKEALQKGVYCSTTSGVLSEALTEYAGATRRPAVIYNTFPWAERKHLDAGVPDRRDRSIPSLYWFSQVTSAGRGLEELFTALHFVAHPLEIHLRGTLKPGYEAVLRALAPDRCQSRIFFHPQVPHGEVLARIAEHDIGLAAEIPYCESRNLTITNKILHYLLGGIAVLASDTAGQREVAAGNPEGIALYAAREPASLAAALHGLLGDPARLRAAGAANLELARTRFSWEVSAGVLRDEVERALAVPVS